jgi:hypothetical protein
MVRRSEQRRPGKPRAVSSPAPVVKESPMKQMRMSERGGGMEKCLWRRYDGIRGSAVCFRSLVRGAIALVKGVDQDVGSTETIDDWMDAILGWRVRSRICCGDALGRWDESLHFITTVWYMHLCSHRCIINLSMANRHIHVYIQCTSVRYTRACAQESLPYTLEFLYRTNICEHQQYRQR